MGSLLRIIALWAATNLLVSQLAFSMEPSLKVIGTVTGKGDVKVETSFNNLVEIDRPFPCYNGLHLKTGDGSAAINLKNGIRLDVGKTTELIMAGEKDYSVNLLLGGLSFSVPEGVNLTISTPSASISTSPISGIKRVSSDSAMIKGIVIFDGKGTNVVSLSGVFTVREINGTTTQIVSTGKAIYLGNDKADIRTVVLPSGLVGGGSALAAALPGIIGSAVVLGTYFTVNSTVKVKAVSPWRP